LIDTSRYEAFGEKTDATGVVANKYLFAGEQYDENLGDYYLRARYYDTDSGRFTRRDDFEGVLSNPLSLHKYGYVNGNPVNYGDPSGYVNLIQILAVIAVANILWDVVNPFNFGGFDPFSDTLFPKIDPTGGLGGKINFNPTYDFVQESILYRSMNQISRNRNVAVVQYRDASGKLKLRAAENVTEAEAGLPIHAEQMITQEILQMGIRPKDVVRIYSEYQPCNYGLNNCASFLSQNFPSAKIYWSFDYNVSKSLKNEVLQRRRMEFEKYDLYKK